VFLFNIETIINIFFYSKLLIKWQIKPKSARFQLEFVNEQTVEKIKNWWY
jgi:hypothetical protein